jgi:hypothetical protein
MAIHMHGLVQSVGKNGVLLGALLGDDCLTRDSCSALVAGVASFDQGYD